MDASPIQSGSKCGGSDFSIERILGARKDHEESVEVPKWLCCTRYRPPRLPRTSTVCRARRAGRHARVPFTVAQAAALEAAYARAPYLAPPALKALAAALHLRDDRIKIWFQNRRARERREKSAIIAPPQGVTLVATTLANGFPSNTWIPQGNFSITASTQALFTRKIDTPKSRMTSKDKSINSPDVVNTMIYKVPQNSEERFDDQLTSMTSFGSNEDADEDRPGTPLDIETVED